MNRPGQHGKLSRFEVREGEELFHASCRAGKMQSEAIYHLGKVMPSIHWLETYINLMHEMGGLIK